MIGQVLPNNIKNSKLLLNIQVTVEFNGVFQINLHVKKRVSNLG